MRYEVRKANGGWHVIYLLDYKAVAWVPSNRREEAEVICYDCNSAGG
jgi:hypothetical protein